MNAWLGSSPRVRGTLMTRHNPLVPDRFIPARAGNTPEVLDVLAVHRFIPARAGNAMIQASTSEAQTVHPRACGEHAHPTVNTIACFRFIPARAGNAVVICETISHGVGSSPRVRGTRVNGKGHIPFERFIPARAGNAGYLILSACIPTVHPRACGERGPPRM